ncbi:Uncharacterised protein [Mycolicibacterium smegmatis]|nr:Uncharacterised protein [Mycolicibacterium smegmatis]
MKSVENSAHLAKFVSFATHHKADLTVRITQDGDMLFLQINSTVVGSRGGTPFPRFVGASSTELFSYFLKSRASFDEGDACDRISLTSGEPHTLEYSLTALQNRSWRNAQRRGPSTDRFCQIFEV